MTLSQFGNNQTGNNMAKKKKEEDLDEYEMVTIDQNTAIARAATYLEQAGDLAVRNRDVNGMLLVAEGWMRINNMLIEEEHPSFMRDRRGPFGFVTE